MSETNRVTQRILIRSDLDIVSARLKVREIAREMGFGTIDQARISLAASELARILAQNVGQIGELLVSGVNSDEHRGIQVVSLSPDENGLMDEDQANEVVSNAIALVDEGFIDVAENRNTRVTLMKWLK